MPTRRTFFAALAATAASLPLAGAPAAWAARPALRRYGDFYIVEGWVLTRRDVEALGLDAG